MKHPNVITDLEARLSEIESGIEENEKIAYNPLETQDNRGTATLEVFKQKKLRKEFNSAIRFLNLFEEIFADSE